MNDRNSLSLIVVATDGRRSQLEQTLSHFLLTLSPRRAYALVPARDEACVHSELRTLGVRVAGMPAGVGCACGLLPVLAEVLDDCPRAEVVVVSDHACRANRDSFVQALLLARRQLDLAPAVVLGATSSAMEASRDWLLPGRELDDGVYELAEAELASNESEHTRQLARGAMYNTSSFIALGRFLWQVLADESPAQAKVVVRAQRAGRSSIPLLEQSMIGFEDRSRHMDVVRVLFQQSRSIAVTRVDDTQPRNWGTSERPLPSMSSLPTGLAISAMGGNRER